MSHIRLLTLEERELLDCMLSAEYPGKQQVANQLDNVHVEPIDDNGSLRFIVTTSTIAPVVRRIPVEAEAIDTDGICIHALLHVVDGKVQELEIYKDDSSAVADRPNPQQWQIIVPG
jgi:hypothetical protein